MLLKKITQWSDINLSPETLVDEYIHIYKYKYEYICVYIWYFKKGINSDATAKSTDIKPESLGLRLLAFHRFDIWILRARLLFSRVRRGPLCKVNNRFLK